MNFTAIHAEDIHFGERQRQKFDDKKIEELADSIMRVGLIHAPVLTESYELVAGERRLRALAITESLGKYKYGGEEYEYPEVPVHLVPYKDPKLLFEIELEENIRRENLTPIEQAQAIAKLHNIRKEANPAQTKKETAQEMASLQGKEPNANDEVIVANSILVDMYKDDPEVQKAAKTSLNKAAKVAKKKAEALFLTAIQESGASQKPDNFFRIFNGDSGVLLADRKVFPANHYDVLLFDPPYGSGADKFGEQAAAIGHQYEDSFDAAAIFLDSIMSNIEVMKENSHVLMFCSPDYFTDWRNYYVSHGFKVWPRPLIWAKGNGHLPVPDGGPRYTYEAILFARKGKRTTKRVINDVLSVSPVSDKIHAAEKPAELLSTLIDFIAAPGDRILDPCCGSGSIFAAGRDREVFIDGIELDKNYYHISRDRAM